MRRIFINPGDIILITERDFDTKKVDIISKFESSQLDYLKDHLGSKMPNFNKLNSENDVLFQDKLNDTDHSDSDDNYLEDSDGVRVEDSDTEQVNNKNNL